MRRNVGAVLTCVIGLLSSGCGNFADLLPTSVDLTLPDTRTEKALRGAGAATLEHTRWRLFNADTGRFIAEFRFGEEGALGSVFENNVIGVEVFGNTIVADGIAHPGRMNGVSYRAATYGAENDSGFAYQARAVVTLAGVRVGSGQASAVGWHDGEQMEGTFSYRIRLENAGAVSLPKNFKSESEFPFYGIRAAEE